MWLYSSMLKPLTGCALLSPVLLIAYKPFSFSLEGTTIMDNFLASALILSLWRTNLSSNFAFSPISLAGKASQLSKIFKWRDVSTRLMRDYYRNFKAYLPRITSSVQL